jgi:hypothetical protein
VTLATKPIESTRPPQPVADDVRARRPYILAAGPLHAVTRRLASVAALVFLDVLGLALGLYAALIVREYVIGTRPILWGFLWREAESEWLPFLVLVMVLVFWRNGLYGAREYRGGLGRIVASLVLVAGIALAFGIGTGYHFSTYAIFPTGLLFTVLLIGLLRSSYDVVTRDIFRIAGVRRRAVLVGAGDNLSHLHASLGEGRSTTFRRSSRGSARTS